MAGYTPSTVVRVLRGIPFDSSYSDTMNFASVSAQLSFMSSKAKYTFNNFSYQRVNSSVGNPNSTNPRVPLSVRVPMIADNLYDCNYIMFQNDGGKWFYAFIEKVNFVSENNCEIQYTIDHYQTWQFDFTIYPSYVEREHTANDTAATQTTPEPLEVDYYVIKQRQSFFETTNYINMGVTYSDKLPAKFKAGGVGSNIYSGLWYYTSTNADEISNTIKELDTLGIGNSIVSIFMSPTPVNQETPASPLVTLFKKDDTLLAGTYSARNKKLANFPYRMVRMVTTDGKQVDLKPQLFNHDALQVTRYLTVNETPVIGFIPAYDNLGDNFQMSVEYSECPQCAWGNSVYANWAAQNMVGNFVKMSASLLAVAGGAATGNPIAMGAGALGIASTFGDAVNKQAQPDVPKGMSSSYAMNYNLNRLGLEIIEYVPNLECCKRLDDFFSMYGYATGLTKIPNMNTRQTWNYVKTKNIILEGSLPVESMVRIKKMFNDGVRFWHTSKVGNYSLDNSIVGGNNDETT